MTETGTGRPAPLSEPDNRYGATARRLAPVTVFGFGKDPYSQTKYRFDGT